jgi:hypothetical protein
MSTSSVFQMGVEKAVDPYAKDFGYTTPGWYFCDESQAYVHGPYESREVAEIKHCEYFKWLNTPKPATA